MIAGAVLFAVAGQHAIATARCPVSGVTDGKSAVLADDGGIEIDQMLLRGHTVRIVTGCTSRLHFSSLGVKGVVLEAFGAIENG